MGVFVGRSEEQDRFVRVLGEVSGRPLGVPDEGFVVLVQGYGGIGKSTLLGRFADIATGRVPAPVRRGRLLVATVNWERDRELHPEDYALFEGPPVWRILERVRAALEAAAAPTWRRRRRVAAAFEGFQRQVTRMKELEEEASRLGIGGLLERQPATPEQLARFIRAGTDLAGVVGVPGVVTAPVARVAEAGAGMLAAAREGGASRVDPALYRALVDEVDAAVTAFADGLRAVARRWPVVVLLDTCELLGGAGPWLREVTRRCGSRAVWTLGIRLEPDQHDASNSEAASYNRDLDEQRLRVIGLTRFDDRTVADYFTRHLGSSAVSQLDIGRIIALTHGIPLAVSLLRQLIADRLDRGLPTNDLYEDVSNDGHVSSVVGGMARRYLVHANREDSDLHQDLPLLIGLVLVHLDQDNPWSNRADSHLLRHSRLRWPARPQLPA